MGVNVEGNYVRKDVEKIIANDDDDLPGQRGLYYDENEVWKKLLPVVPDIRTTLMRIIKKLEKNPEQKKEIKRLYGTSFIEDLGLIADLYAVLK